MTSFERRKTLQQIKWLGIFAVMASMAVAAVWGVFKLPPPIVDRMLESDIRNQASLWQRRVVLHLENADATFNSGYISETDANYLELMPEASDVYRLKMYDASGTVFWSTRNSDVGERTTAAYFQSEIMKGTTYYAHSQVPASDVDDLQLHSNHLQESILHHIAEVYTPVTQNGRVVGAIEFYTDITELRQTFINRVRLLLGVLSGVSVFAMSAVMLLVLRTNRRQFSALSAKSESERDLLNEQLRLAREVQLLGELNEWLQSSATLDELFDMVARFMTHILPNAEGSIYVYSNSRDVLDGCASWNDGVHKDHIHPESCWGLRRGRVYEYGSSEVDFVCEHAEPHDGRPYFCFPILAHGETVGLMHLRAHSEHCEHFSKNKKLARMCAEQISMAISNVRMRDQLHDQSVRDPLTGLFNRRHMTETLRKAISRSQNKGERLSLIAIDVDHFKKFNDNHGHDAGDMVLRAVGSALEQFCDRDEVACRPGGEEFTLILPNCSTEDALTRAELLRQAVEDVTVRYGEKTLPRITISLGVAHYPSHGTMPQDLLRVADDALYEAKARGRNQVYVSSNQHTPAEDEAATEPQDATDDATTGDAAAECNADTGHAAAKDAAQDPSHAA